MLQTRAVCSGRRLFSKPPQHATLGELTGVFRAPLQPQSRDAPRRITAHCPRCDNKCIPRPAGCVRIIEDGASRSKARGAGRGHKWQPQNGGANATRSPLRPAMYFIISGVFVVAVLSHVKVLQRLHRNCRRRLLAIMAGLSPQDEAVCEQRSIPKQIFAANLEPNAGQE